MPHPTTPPSRVVRGVSAGIQVAVGSRAGSTRKRIGSRIDAKRKRYGSGGEATMQPEQPTRSAATPSPGASSSGTGHDAADLDGFYETVGCVGGAAIGHVPERTQHSLELRDAHLADPELLAKHRPWVVRGGSIKTGPFRVVSAKTPWIGFSVAAGWPEIQEAFADRLASMLNGGTDA